MTRTDYEQSVANKLGIINALKDNVGDEFTALEISAAMIDPPDLKPLQIGAVLKSMVAEGLVSKRPSKNMNVYRLTKKALSWTPPPYDWRAEGAMVTPPESAAEPVAPQADNPMEASSQPWVDNSNSPEIPDSSPLPIDSHEDEPLSQPEITPAAISGCGGKGECGHCANHERDSLRQQLDEQETRLSDLAHAEAAAVELESDLAAAREEVEITRAALREARENLKQVREDLGAQLDGRNTLVAEQREHIYDLLTERAKHFDELAASQRERDLLHQRLREQARNEPALMADCLMELLRLALLRIPHPDHYAGVGKMVGSEARP